MNDTAIDIENEEHIEEDNSSGELDNYDQPDSVKESTPTNTGGSNKKNKGKGNYFKNNQSSNNKKGENKQNNNKNENNSKEQNGGSAKSNNSSAKKSLGNSGDKNDHNFVKQMYFFIEGLSRDSKNYPLDSPVLFLLYRCGSVILSKMCIIVWYNLYFRDSIVCVSGFNAKEKIDDFILNICLSYPYLETDDNKTKRYIMFYRWIPYVLGILLIMAYIPRLIIKWFNNSKLHHLLQDLSNASQWYDTSHYKKLEEKLFKYFEENIGALLLSSLGNNTNPERSNKLY